MKKTAIVLLTLGLILTSLGASQAQDQAKQEVELIVIVNAAAKRDSMTEAQLGQSLRGGDNHFELVGLQKQHYDLILKKMVRTNSSDFDRLWIGLIMAGKRKKKPIISENPIQLVALAGKNRNVIVVIDRRGLSKPASEYGAKEVKILKKK